MPKPFVFFGTPYVARDTLATLLESGYRPNLVVSSPDAPKGRGLVLTPSDTKTLAEAEGIPVLTPEKLDATACEEIRTAGEYAIVVAYGKFLPEALIASFPLGVVNIHYSLLPKYRGASPVEAALLNGDATTGVSIQRMVKEMDAGDVLACKEIAIEPTDTTRTLRARLIEEGTKLLIASLPALEDGTLTGTPQDHTQATFARKIDKSEGELDLAGDPQKNWNKYRAYAENPGTFFFTEKNAKRLRVKIKTARFENGAFIPERIVPEGKNETDYALFTS